MNKRIIFLLLLANFFTDVYLDLLYLYLVYQYQHLSTFILIVLCIDTLGI